MRASVLLYVCFTCSLTGCGGTSSVAHVPPANEVEGVPACAPLDRVGAGAGSGSVTLSGHVRDSSGRPIVGAEVRLGGSEQAVRYTSFVGAYAFDVKPGSYGIETGGGCALEPPVVSEQSLEADSTQDFVATDAGCVSVEATNGGQILALQGLCRTIVSIQEEPSHDKAVQQLKSIADEQPETPVCTVAVGADSAVERVAMISGEGPLGGAPINNIAVTTAIAVDATVVRFESSLAATASPEQINLVLAAGRNFTRGDLRELHAK